MDADDTTGPSPIFAKIRATPKEVLTKCLEGVDGWTIFTTDKFLKAGLDPEIVAAFTERHMSGDTPKETIFKEGEAVGSMIGVYGLDVLRAIAGAFGISSYKMGRGSHARHLLEQLLEKGHITPFPKEQS